MKARLLTCILLFPLSILAVMAQPQFRQSKVFTAGREGYHSYRIPAIVRAANGDLLAFCEGRNGQGDSGDIDIVLKRSSDGGISWSGLQLVVSCNYLGVERTAGNMTTVKASNAQQASPGRMLQARPPGPRSTEEGSCSTTGQPDRQSLHLAWRPGVFQCELPHGS